MSANLNQCKQINPKFKSTFIFFISIAFLLVNLKGSSILLYPISFTVIRQTPVSSNLSAYINRISAPSVDANGLNTGYNMVSIGGFTSSTTNLTLSNDLSPLGTWANVFTRVVGSVRNNYGSTNSQIQ